MDARVEYIKVLSTEFFERFGAGISHLGGKCGDIGDIVNAAADNLMAHFGEAGVVYHTVGAEPPFAQVGRYEGGDEAADVDEYVEDLEAGVTLVCVFGVVIQLTYYGLEIAFEQAVAESNQEQRHACQRQQPGGVLGGGKDWNSQKGVSQGHDYKALDDGAFVVLCLVGDDAADQREDVDSGIEARVDDAG